ncbi:MAG: matrixin family metalloprotease [Actinomycetota bacterium]
MPRSIRAAGFALALLMASSPATTSTAIHAAAARPQAKLPAPNACRDGAYTFNGSRWTKPLEWSFRAVSAPKGVTRRAAELALQRAARNIVTGRNDCGLEDKISATQHYLGRTHLSTGISDDSQCGEPDGHNVVGFGGLLPTEMALTCWWSQNGSTVEVDIKLNKVDYRWEANAVSTCRLAWSIESVATHEFGHAFGLDHVGEGLHGTLTMSPLIAPCENGEATLGLGDVRGLRARY